MDMWVYPSSVSESVRPSVSQPVSQSVSQSTHPIQVHEPYDLPCPANQTGTGQRNSKRKHVPTGWRFHGQDRCLPDSARMLLSVCGRRGAGGCEAAAIPKPELQSLLLHQAVRPRTHNKMAITYTLYTHIPYMYTHIHTVYKHTYVHTHVLTLCRPRCPSRSWA